MELTDRNIFELLYADTRVVRELLEGATDSEIKSVRKILGKLTNKQCKKVAREIVVYDIIKDFDHSMNIGYVFRENDNRTEYLQRAYSVSDIEKFNNELSSIWGVIWN